MAEQRKYLEKDLIVFNEDGNFYRLGDYFGSKDKSTPFSLCCEEAGVFSSPQITGRGSSRTMLWRDDRNTLQITSRLTYDPECRVISRRDTLQNTGNGPLVIRRYFARIPLNCGEYELYTQSSRWRKESVGSWKKLDAGTWELFSREGRWCEGATPYAALRDNYTDHALAFLVCPAGDWMLRFICPNKNGAQDSVTVEAGLSDERLALTLAPGEKWEAPEVLIQILPGREPGRGCALLDRFLNRRFPARPGHAPVSYNTWLDRANELDVPRLRRQLAAAKECGCEVFIIDYGWYEDHQAWCRVDDWAECQDKAFFGKMREFSDEVRAAGLGFGFWVEMEFFSTQSEVVKKHPDWFFPSAHKEIVCPKSWLPEVEDYLVESMAATIRRYDAVYVKNDMNHTQGWHPDHLSRFQTGMFRVLARLHELLPQVTFDNCSSGGMRMAAGGMLANFDIHFISDNANQIDNLRQVQGMMLRFPPGRILHWFAASELHPAAEPAASFKEGMIVEPQGSSWDSLEKINLNTALLANMTGIPGYSCDLDSFSPKNRKKIFAVNAFYKKYRRSLLRSEGFWLTPQEHFEKRTGWFALQFTDPEKELHFLYVFHDLSTGSTPHVFHAAELKSDLAYSVSECFPDKTEMETAISGAELMKKGVTVSFADGMYGWTHIQAKLILISPVKSGNGKTVRRKQNDDHTS